MVHPSDKHYCPLVNADIFYGGYGGCIEIQEVRENNMDMELLPFEIDIPKANVICEKCRWFTGENE